MAIVPDNEWRMPTLMVSSALTESGSPSPRLNIKETNIFMVFFLKDDCFFILKFLLINSVLVLQLQAELNSTDIVAVNILCIIPAFGGNIPVLISQEDVGIVAINNVIQTRFYFIPA